MFKKAFFLCLAVLLTVAPTSATDFVGVVHISATTFHRFGTLPLGDAVVHEEEYSNLFSLFGKKWNDVGCSASAWEFSQSDNPPTACPGNFSIWKVTSGYPHFRMPPIQTPGGWNGHNLNKTVPIQFLNDYDTDFSLFQFSVQAVGYYPSRSALSSRRGATDAAIYTVGDIALFTGNFIPSGYLPADGRSLSKTEYPELYRAIGDRYTKEITEGQNTFDLPTLSSAVIYHDGNYKEITPLIRARIDAYSIEEPYIADIVISANPNRTSGENSSLAKLFSPIDEKKRTLPLTSYTSLYSLIGDKFGLDRTYRNINLPTIKLKPEAQDTDQVFFYIVTQGRFPSRPD